MISHPRATVFVHIPKTGGQSIETVFLRDLGLGWRDRDALLLRHNADPAVGPEKLAHLYADEYVRLGHMQAAQFDAYTKFAVVRHPYDRAVSEYRYRLAARARRSARGQALSFDAFMTRHYGDDYTDLSRHMAPQVRYVHDQNGVCLVDHVLRFETLSQDIAPLIERIFGEERRLPVRNRTKAVTGFGVDHLTCAQKDALFTRFEADFSAFGYLP
jgi:hypothetical protein